VKALMIGLFLASTSLFAHTEDGSRVLLAITRPGTYQGVIENTEIDCEVSISRTSDGVLVTAQSEGLRLSHLVKNGPNYRANIGRRFFLSEYPGQSTFRTIMTDDPDYQYMVVEEKGRMIECIVAF
jgi:hypothetical protein